MKPNESNSPASPDPQTSPKKSFFKQYRLLFGLVAGTMLLTGGGLGLARYFIFQRLAPTISEQLSDTINRPLILGEVQSFSLDGGIRLGISELPATETETDSVLLQGVIVKFDLLPLLTQQQLNLDLTLLNPQIYIEQDVDNVWLALDIDEPDDDDDEGGLEVDIGDIYIKNADLTVRSRLESGTLQTPIEIQVPSGKAELVQGDQVIEFDLDGVLKRGGDLNVVGAANLSDSSFNLDIRAKKVQMSTITDLLPLPFTLSDGIVDGQLAMDLAPGGELSSWQGEVITEGTTLLLEQLAKPITGMKSKIRFSEQKLNFSDLSGTLDKINLAGAMELDLSGTIQGELLSEPVAILDVMSTFDLDSPEFVIDGDIQTTVEVTGALEEPQLNINAVNAGTLTFDRLTFSRFQGAIAIIGTNFVVNNFVALPTLGGQFQGQGLIQLPTEALPAGDITVSARGTQLPMNAFAQLYEIPTPVPLGTGQGDFVFASSVEKVDEFVVSGQAVVPVAGGLVTATALNVTKDRWATPATARNLRLAELYTDVLPPFAANSLVDGEFEATGALSPDAADPDPLNVTGQARTTLAGGRAIADNLRVKDGIWRTDIKLSGLELKQLAPDLPPVDATYAGEFIAAGTLDNPSADAIEMAGIGRLTLADGGVVRTEDVTVAKGEWYSRAEVDNVNLVNFSPQLGNYVSNVPTNGSFEVRGTLDNIALEGILARGSGVASLAGGQVRAKTLTLQQGTLQTSMVASGVALFPFSNQLTGLGSGEFDVVADAINPDLSRLQAKGTARFSEGISLITSPLTSEFAWTGSQLQIQEAIATNFAANGIVDIDTVQLALDPVTAVTNVALNLNISEFELATLPLPPNTKSLALSGTTSFVGTVQGQPLRPQVNGNVRLDQVAVGDLILEKALTGAVQTRSDRRMVVDLRGSRDRLMARLNPNFRPEQAQMQVGETKVDLAVQYANNNLDPQQLQLTTDNVPVTLVQAIALDQPQFQQLDFPLADIKAGGTLSSELTANLQNLSASGRLVVAAPSLGSIQGDRLQGQFFLSNDRLVVQDVAWLQNDSRYGVGGTIDLPNNNRSQPTIALTGEVEQGRIEDILVAMQLFDVNDFQSFGQLSLPDYFGPSTVLGNSDDLYANAKFVKPGNFPKKVTSLSVPLEPDILQDDEARETFSCQDLLQQDQRLIADTEILSIRNAENLTFAERLALLDCVKTQLALSDRRIQQTILPAPLADLTGEINGTVSMNFDSDANLEAEFDLRGGYQEIEQQGETVLVGSPWQWGELEIPHLVAKGVLRNNVLTLRPVNIQLPDDAKVTFIGSFGGVTQTGQLGLVDIPVAFLQKFVELPDAVGVQGLINANANLAGTPQDPSARGNMSMTNARINDADINAVTGNFTYEDARLDFAVEGELIADTQPLTVSGSIPYQLPTATVAPESNDLNLAFNLEDEGFILLNILSQGQLAWLDGQGSMDLSIEGEIDLETGRPEELVAKGQVAIADAEIQAQTLPDAPLTNVQAKIDFNFDNFTVQELTGDFSGGSVTVTGSLPIAEANAEATPDVEDTSDASDETASEDDSSTITKANAAEANTAEANIEDTPDANDETVPEDGSPAIAEADAKNTLTVELQELNFELLNLYKGGVDGKLLIAGSALEPIIGGDINLSEGRVFLVDQEPTEAAPTSQGFTGIRRKVKAIDKSENRPGVETIKVEGKEKRQEKEKGKAIATSTNTSLLGTKQTKQNKSTKRPINPVNTQTQPNVDLTAITEFRDLNITLGKNLQVTKDPILNFLATGNMIYNGTLIDPKPQGVIELKRGQVNLFATQFRLDKEGANTATFEPELGLDPVLDVLLQTSLISTPQSSVINTDPLSAEVQDNSVFSATQIGTVETIRVQAIVQGQASRLNEITTLSSSPPRSETELVALLGGSLLDSFTSDSTNLALANLAGSALLNSIQDTIGTALGLSEFRLFPTVITDDDEGDRGSTLGLGAEVGVDISENFSLSILQILNSSEAAQFGVRYRVNDQIFLRGSSNLNNDSRVTVEYDLKF